MGFLTKSLFKVGITCPTKLHYTRNSKLYASSKLTDSFLEALAKGGYQVGELAKSYYAGGHQVEGLDYESAVQTTNEYLVKDNTILYEPAFLHKNLFVRVDILRKKGNRLELIETKSKSFQPRTFHDEVLQAKKQKLSTEWASYICDIAFQTYVVKLAYPNMEVVSYLMCADKEKRASVDGLNQSFLVRKGQNGRMEVRVKGSTDPDSLGVPILTAVDVTDVVDKVLTGKCDDRGDYGIPSLNFVETVWSLAENMKQGTKAPSEVGAKCKKCEFRKPEGWHGLRSGFNECWRESVHSLTEEEVREPFAFDVWFSPRIKEPRVLMRDIEKSDFPEKKKKNNKNKKSSNKQALEATLRSEEETYEPEKGLTRSERQWLQIEKVKNGDHSEYIDRKGLRDAMSRFTYPLHFIDFETSMVAIPFNKGMKPYEQIAFQFSHHVMEKDGSYRHEGEWISATPGEFPNFLFVRALKKQLENDSGTIFRYSDHENTVLGQIREQLREEEVVGTAKDRTALIQFIESITHGRALAGSDSSELYQWAGERDMVDLCDLVKKYYYNPITDGSNSIKRVLPAVLRAQGKGDFDPYKSLPPIFHGAEGEILNSINDSDEIGDGGAAMTAYAMMQFKEMSDTERGLTKEALLRYCKLDTEAMVWIFQYLKGCSESS